MDRALWITWHDLAEAGREPYLAWLKEAYIPANPEMNAWTDSFVRKLLHAPGSPNVAQRVAYAVAKKRA